MDAHPLPDNVVSLRRADVESYEQLITHLGEIESPRGICVTVLHKDGNVEVVYTGNDRLKLMGAAVAALIQLWVAPQL